MALFVGEAVLQIQEYLRTTPVGEDANSSCSITYDGGSAASRPRDDGRMFCTGRTPVPPDPNAHYRLTAC